MALNLLKILKGLRIIPETSTAVSAKGELEVIDSTGKLQYHNGTTVSPVVTEAHAQDITGKTLLEVDNLQLNGNTVASTNSNGNIVLDPNGTGQIVAESAVVLPEASTPATPSSGYGKIYFKTDGYLYQLNDNGTETRVGTGTGSINYILNGTFESDADGVLPSGWALYEDAAASTPVNGTGVATSNEITFLAENTSPLRGNISAVLTKDAANRQGEGVSYDFTISDADKYAVLAGNLDYEIASGTYADGDLTFYIYDVTNSSLIQPAGYSLSNVGVESTKQFTFQGTGSTSYRLIIHVASTSASAYSVKFDNISVGPQVKSIGVVPKAPTVQTFTSGSGTYTKPAGVKFLKVTAIGGGGGGGAENNSGTGGNGGNTTFGTSLIIANGGGGGSYTGNAGGTGAANSPAIQIITVQGGHGADGMYAGSALPSGMQIVGGAGGVTALGGNGRATGQTGSGGSAYANTGAGGSGAPTFTSSRYAGAGGGAGAYTVGIINNPSSSYSYAVGAGGTAGSDGGALYDGGAGGSGIVIVEEFYHGENVETSDQSSEGRVVALRATLAAAQTGVSDKVIPFDTAAVDTHSGLNLTTGVYTVKVPGVYRISATCQFASSGTPNNDAIYIRKNTSNYSMAYAANLTASTTGTFAQISDVLNLVAGDTIDIYVDADASFDIDNNGRTRFTMERLSGNQTVMAGESVFAYGSNSAGTSVADDTWAAATWNAENGDSHSALGSTLFTAPISGTYLLASNVSFAPNATGQRGLRLVGAGVVRAEVLALPSASYNLGHSATALVRLLAGETAYVSVYQNSGGALALTNSAAYNTFSVVRVGNY